MVNLTGSNLTNAGVEHHSGWAPEMDQAWRDSAGILTLLPGAIPPLLGDYNRNGIVDAADYTV